MPDGLAPGKGGHLPLRLRAAETRERDTDDLLAYYRQGFTAAEIADLPSTVWVKGVESLLAPPHATGPGSFGGHPPEEAGRAEKDLVRGFVLSGGGKMWRGV